MTSRTQNLTYWISTVLVVVNFAFGGISSVFKAGSSLEIIRHLGYPDYFAVMLGAAQFLGALAITVPVPRLLREWAYAGLAFDGIAAIVSQLATGAPVAQTIFPIVALGLILASHATWRSRSGLTPVSIHANQAKTD